MLISLTRVGSAVLILAVTCILTASLFVFPSFRAKTAALSQPWPSDNGSRGKPWRGWLSSSPPATIDAELEIAYNQIFSLSTLDKRYFKVSFVTRPAINPSILPHPTDPDAYYVVAQAHRTSDGLVYYFVELVCIAKFDSASKLACNSTPSILTIAATPPGPCPDSLAHVNFNIGPHDARVFHGPEAPYVIYGSNSQYSCFGQFLQDLRSTTDWPIMPPENNKFRTGTDLARPGKYGVFEKNWFPFWDHSKQIYLHHDTYPHRTFAKLDRSGSVGSDLGHATRKADDKCIERFWPRISDKENETIHQSTNSLSVVLCRRADPECVPTPANTMILSVFQHKINHSPGGIRLTYEPYVMLFSRTAPFALHGVSKKPFWIAGRTKAEGDEPSQMLYVTSVNYKNRTALYDGYLDDVVMVGFGIQDRDTGGIDVTVADLIGDLNLCAQ